jgi:hypothetical protein
MAHSPTIRAQAFISLKTPPSMQPPFGRSPRGQVRIVGIHVLFLNVWHQSKIGLLLVHNGINDALLLRTSAPCAIPLHLLVSTATQQHLPRIAVLLWRVGHSTSKLWSHRCILLHWRCPYVCARRRRLLLEGRHIQCRPRFESLYSAEWLQLSCY